MSKALVYENTGKVILKSIERKKDKNILKVISAGLCGTDKHLLKGHLGQIGPFVLGHEVIGIIDSLSNEEEIFGGNFKVGDRVTFAAGINCGHCINCLQKKHYCLNRYSYGFTKYNQPKLNGGFAEYIELEPRTSVFKIPDNMSNDTAVFAELMACLVGAIEMVQTTKNFTQTKKTLIIGSGPAGICAYIAAEFYGLDVYITDINEKALEVAKKCGIKKIVSSVTEKDYDSYGVVFDMAGTNSSFDKCIKLASIGGTIIEFGAYSKTEPLKDFEFWKICQKELTIKGCEESVDANFLMAFRILENTQYNIEACITERFLIDEVDEINEFLLGDSVGKGLVEM